MKNNEASSDTSDTKDIEQKLIGIEKKFKVYRKRFLIVIYVSIMQKAFLYLTASLSISLQQNTFTP